MKRITLIILATMAIIAGGVSCNKNDVTPQSSMPLVSMSIIPDFSDGSVYSFSDDGSFFLRVSVTPEKYIEKLSEKDGFICKADFRSVITKDSPENPDFTVVGEITSVSVEEGCMTAYFDLAEDVMEKMWDADYVVSLSMEDADGAHGASTSYVPVSWYTREGEGGSEQFAAVDLGLSVKWANMNLQAADWTNKKDRYVTMWGIKLPRPLFAADKCSWGDYLYCVDPGSGQQNPPKFSKYCLINEPMYWGCDGVPDGRIVLEAEDDAATYMKHGDWRTPTLEEFEELFENCDISDRRRVLEFKSRINGNSILLPGLEPYYDEIWYWTSTLKNTTAAYCIRPTKDKFGKVSRSRYEWHYIRPVLGKRKVASITMETPSLQLVLHSTSTLKASVYPEAAPDRSIVWSSSNPDVASVDAQGNVTAVSVGEATITAKTNDGGFTATSSVTVVLPDVR